MTQDTRSENYKKWYERNKDTYNARRRERYKNDKEYRDIAKQHTSNYKRKLTNINREKYSEMFTVDQAANEIKMHKTTIRNWIKAGFIPKPNTGVIRFTKEQVELIREFYKLSMEYKNKSDLNDKQNELSKYIKENWDISNEAKKEN